MYVCYYRHLLEEFQTEKEKWKEEKENMINELTKLYKENQIQSELLAIELDKNPQCDAILQADLNKLNYDNLVRPKILYTLHIYYIINNILYNILYNIPITYVIFTI